jgi:hypothetical protein
MCAIRGGRRLRTLQRGDAFIKDHGDVTNKQNVNAVLNAVAKPKGY